MSATRPLARRTLRPSAAPAAEAESAPATPPPARASEAAATRLDRLRRPAAVLAAVGVLALAGVAYWFGAGRSSFSGSIIHAPGRLEVRAVAVPAAVSTPLADLAVAEGDFVTEGQVLGHLDLSRMRSELERADALIAQSKLALEAAQTEAAQRRNQLQGAEGDLRRLQSRASASRQQLEQRQSARDAAQAALTAAAADEAGAQQAYEGARKDAERLHAETAEDRIVAPRAGRVQYRFAEPGEDLHVGSPIVTIIGPQDVALSAQIPLPEAGQIKPGAEARVVLDGFPNEPFPASVTYLGKNETTIAGVGPTLRVRLRAGPELSRIHSGELRTGLAAEAYIATRTPPEWPAQLRTQGQ
jgi:HlyD family secretion protein